MTLNTKQLNTVIGLNMQEFFNDIEIIKNPISKTAVVFQCDEKFFNEYGIYNLLSCEQNDLDAHIHFINPSQSFLDKISNLQTDINLSYSIEHINTDINHYKLKSYYFCSRYFITNHLFENNMLDSAYITDADIIFNEKINLPSEIKLGVLYYPQFDNLWKQTGANITYVHKDRKLFLEKIINLYNHKLDSTNFDVISNTMDKFERANLYALDQVCMSMVIEEFMDDKFLNISSIKNLIGKNTTNTIWSLTGGGQKGNPEIKELLSQRFREKLQSQFKDFR